MNDEQTPEKTTASSASDLFGSSSIRPLFPGEANPAPEAKPLFSAGLPEQGDAAFVKPLFASGGNDSGNAPEKKISSARTPTEEAPGITVETTVEPDKENNKIESSAPEGSVEPEISASAPGENAYTQVEGAREPEKPLVVEADSQKSETPAASIPSVRADSPETTTLTQPKSDESAYIPAGKNAGTLPEEPVTPVRRAEPAPEPRKVKHSGVVSIAGDPEKLTIGELMKEARKSAGYSIEDAYTATRIKTAYIQAIETDNISALPKGLFPMAYVRSLCSLYNLDKAGTDAAAAKIGSFQKKNPVPESLYQELEARAQHNVAEEKRIRRIFLIVAAAFVALLLLITGIVIAASAGKGKTIPKQVSPVQTVSGKDVSQGVATLKEGTDDLEKLSPPRLPVMRKLPVPAK